MASVVCSRLKTMSVMRQLDILFYVKFPMAFRSVKSIFQSYLSIAGWQSLVLTYVGTMGIFKGFSTVMIDPDTRLANCGIAMENLMLVVLISCFGDYFKQSILSNQRKIEDLAGNEQSGDVKWYLGWKVELTARNFFVVHHPLILHVVATVLTFFIFMFQLKLYDNADAPERAGLTYNCTAEGSTKSAPEISNRLSSCWFIVTHAPVLLKQTQVSRELIN